jgi:cell division protein ZapA
MKTTQTTVEILGKPYFVRCPESEAQSLQAAANYLNQKMREVQESGKAINLERIAIMAALNITYELLQQSQQKNNFMQNINQRIANLQDKLDHAIHQPQQTELVYTAD